MTIFDELAASATVGLGSRPFQTNRLPAGLAAPLDDPAAPLDNIAAPLDNPAAPAGEDATTSAATLDNIAAPLDPAATVGEAAAASAAPETGLGPPGSSPLPDLSFLDAAALLTLSRRSNQGIVPDNWELPPAEQWAPTSELPIVVTSLLRQLLAEPAEVAAAALQLMIDHQVVLPIRWLPELATQATAPASPLRQLVAPVCGPWGREVLRQNPSWRALLRHFAPDSPVESPSPAPEPGQDPGTDAEPQTPSPAPKPGRDPGTTAAPDLGPGTALPADPADAPQPQTPSPAPEPGRDPGTTAAPDLGQGTAHPLGTTAQPTGAVQLETVPPVDEDTWLHGSLSERVAWLRRLRQADPELARQKLAQVWSKSKAAEKAELIQALDTGLGVTDSELLDKARLDRSEKVSVAGLELLSRLPQGSFADQRAELIRSHFQVTKSLFSRKLTALPFAEDKSQGIAEGAIWSLVTFIRYTPLPLWQQVLELDPVKLIELKLDGVPWDVAEAFQGAAITQRDFALVNTLIAQGHKPHQLLPPEQVDFPNRLLVVRHVLAEEDTTQAMQLAKTWFGAVLPAEILDDAIKALAKHPYPLTQRPTAMMLLRANPAQLGKLRQLIGDLPDNQRGSATRNIDLLTLLARLDQELPPPGPRPAAVPTTNLSIIPNQELS